MRLSLTLNATPCSRFFCCTARTSGGQLRARQWTLQCDAVVSVGFTAIGRGPFSIEVESVTAVIDDDIEDDEDDEEDM
jgi:hypothetical protein